MKEPLFRPKILDTLQNYNRKSFTNDLIAGLILGIVALPLAIAFGIASGVSPEKGLITAIVAGFLISALGGSRVQIGGPTGAFIVIVYGIVLEYGIDGLITAVFLAGIMLIIMGIARMGSLIKYIPHSLIIGFTSGIAIIIFSSQIKDFFGLSMGDVPADFVEKWFAFGTYADTFNWYAILISGISILIILLFPLISKKIPGSLIAIIITTLAVQLLDIPVETIGSRFGVITSSLTFEGLPEVNFRIVKEMVGPAFTIAMLGAIESLLSAVVADGMIGGNHRSNTELIGQGIANIGSALFGGIPATGAIARTATNVRSKGSTPVAGIIHALMLLLILIFLGQWSALIPLSCLAAILVIISIDMSGYRSFISVFKGPRGDIAVMMTTFILTVFVDLTVAIPVGIILASFSFIQKVSKNSEVILFEAERGNDVLRDEFLNEKFNLPQGVTTFEISGPMFFGASYKIREVVKHIRKRPKVLIIRMRHVFVIDATGIISFKEMIQDINTRGTTILISELNHPQVYEELKKSGILNYLSIFTSFEEAVNHSKGLLENPSLSLSKQIDKT